MQDCCVLTSHTIAITYVCHNQTNKDMRHAPGYKADRLMTQTARRHARTGFKPIKIWSREQTKVVFFLWHGVQKEKLSQITHIHLALACKRHLHLYVMAHLANITALIRSSQNSTQSYRCRQSCWQWEFLQMWCSCLSATNFGTQHYTG